MRIAQINSLQKLQPKFKGYRDNSDGDYSSREQYTTRKTDIKKNNNESQNTGTGIINKIKKWLPEISGKFKTFGKDSKTKPAEINGDTSQHSKTEPGKLNIANEEVKEAAKKREEDLKAEQAEIDRQEAIKLAKKREELKQAKIVIQEAKEALECADKMNKEAEEADIATKDAAANVKRRAVLARKADDKIEIARRNVKIADRSIESLDLHIEDSAEDLKIYKQEYEEALLAYEEGKLTEEIFDSKADIFLDFEEKVDKALREKESAQKAKIAAEEVLSEAEKMKKEANVEEAKKISAQKANLAEIAGEKAAEKTKLADESVEKAAKAKASIEGISIEEAAEKIRLEYLFEKLNYKDLYITRRQIEKDAGKKAHDAKYAAGYADSAARKVQATLKEIAEYEQSAKYHEKWREKIIPPYRVVYTFDGILEKAYPYIENTIASLEWKKEDAAYFKENAEIAEADSKKAGLKLKVANEILGRFVTKAKMSEEAKEKAILADMSDEEVKRYKEEVKLAQKADTNSIFSDGRAKIFDVICDKDYKHLRDNINLIFGIGILQDTDSMQRVLVNEYYVKDGNYYMDGRRVHTWAGDPFSKAVDKDHFEELKELFAATKQVHSSITEIIDKADYANNKLSNKIAERDEVKDALWKTKTENPSKLKSDADVAAKEARKTKNFLKEIKRSLKEMDRRDSFSYNNMVALEEEFTKKSMEQTKKAEDLAKEIENRPNKINMLTAKLADLDAEIAKLKQMNPEMLNAEAAKNLEAVKAQLAKVIYEMPDRVVTLVENRIRNDSILRGYCNADINPRVRAEYFKYIKDNL